jgi:type IV pilus assembly protein PilB
MSKSYSETSAIALVNELFMQAVKDNASDVHIEPQGDFARVRYRIDGILNEIRSIPAQTSNAVVSRIKIIAEMDIAEKRVPQDGRFQMKFDQREIDLRISTMPTVYGEKVVARILDRGNIDRFNVATIGLSDDYIKKLKSIVGGSRGLLLITGPTGSGKTTTLYAAVKEINQVEKNIITVEDPVEYLIGGINQTQVNIKAGMTFAVSLRAILRQDPDVIMVGEIRDKETADVAVRAAITGHLVLSTMHTNNAAGAITRLMDMGIEPYMVASAVSMATAQRLIRRICPACSSPYELEAGAIDRVFLGLSPEEPVTLYRGSGCVACNYLGYRGRIALHEVLTSSGDLRQMILKNELGDELVGEPGVGLVSLGQDGVGKVLAGLTTIEELRRTL